VPRCSAAFAAIFQPAVNTTPKWTPNYAHFVDDVSLLVSPAEKNALNRRKFCGDYTYIWQASDWPSWYYDLAALARPMAEVSRAQGLLMGRLADVGMALRDQASLAALTECSVSRKALQFVFLRQRRHFQSGSAAIDLADDGVCGFGPDKGLWVGVIVLNVVVDGAFEFQHARENASADAL